MKRRIVQRLSFFTLYSHSTVDPKALVICAEESCSEVISAESAA